MATKKTTTTKKTVTKNAIESPYSKMTVSDKEVPIMTRVVLLLDSRPELIAMYFGGLQVVAREGIGDGKKDSSFASTLNAVNLAFYEEMRSKNTEKFKKYTPTLNVMDIAVNKKGEMRFIILLRLNKEGKLSYVWADPNNARAPVGECAENTMLTWLQK